MFINIPVRYNYDALSQNDIDELIAAKIVKEANRIIQQWPEEKITLENERWGAIIKMGKKKYKLTGSGAKGKYTPEELTALTIDDVKKMIVAQEPKAFDKKAPAKKKAAVKKAAVKKVAVKKK
jgi:DNA topoisomerase I